MTHTECNQLIAQHNKLQDKQSFLYMDTQGSSAYTQGSNTYASLLTNIMQRQESQGTCVIRWTIEDYNALTHLVHVLSAWYKQVCMVRPSIVHPASGIRWIVCQRFDVHIASSSMSYNTSPSLPLHWLYKWEEHCVIVGQQILEAREKMLQYLSRNNGSFDSTTEKIYTQKCIQWCNKHQVSYNCALPQGDDEHPDNTFIKME